MSIFNHFQHLALSPDQSSTLEKLEAFLESSTQVFMLKGYAGSGKTTILKGLVEYLDSEEKAFALMAPTGRAAKVIRERTGQAAFTIHKSIYSYDEMAEVEEGESFFYYYKLRNNPDASHTIFIVDEASMLSDAKSEGEFFRFGTGHLLTDLISYSRVNSKMANSKIIFGGDPCQLAPVGDNSSKAFDKEYLTEKFQLSIEESEMKEVMRQSGESGILKAASKMRKSITAGFYNDFSLKQNKKDIFNPSYESFLDTYENTVAPKIIIASKNKTCLQLNQQIRERKHGEVNLPLQKGDIVIMGGNNYRKEIFNGEFAVVDEVSPNTISRTIALRGKEPVTLTWRDIELIFPDADNNNKIVTGKVIENFLYGDNYLKPEEMQALYVDFTTRNKGLKPKSEEFKQAIINDEYFNSLLIKYGYAVTCHKAQGGEWDNVFTVWDQDNTKDFNYLSDNQLRAGKTNEGFYRWAYTAITRASKQLFAVNPPDFNSYAAMSFIDTVVADSLKEITGQQVEAEEIDLDNELLHQLMHFGLLSESIQLQDHFIKVRHTIRKYFIEVIGWEKNSYEIIYHFKRENNTAGLKTWFNKEDVFNGKYFKLSALTNSESLVKEIEGLLKNLANVSVKRNTVETITQKIAFEFSLEEQLPFTKNLFDDLLVLLNGAAIIIENIEHMKYKERYTFNRNQEQAVVDFEYTLKGFFGRVVPLKNKTNSSLLLKDIQMALSTFKQTVNAS